MNKKKRILAYFNNKKPDSLFEELLSLYITGELKALLKSWKLTHISIHVDWNEINKCIDVQAKYKQYYYEWQFYENDCEYMIYIDGKEPDEASCVEYNDINEVQDLISKMRSLLPTEK